MRRLAERYIDIYSMLGHAGASEWYDNFLDTEHRKRISPFIRQVAEERNLQVD